MKTEEEIERMSAEEIAKSLDELSRAAADAPAEPAAPAAPEPQKEYEIKLETGQVYRGATQEEAVQKLMKAQEMATQAIRDREEQIWRMKQQITTPQVQTVQGLPQPQNATTFNNTEYINLLASDPLAAQDYLNRAYYGIDNPREAFQRAAATAALVNDSLAVAEFKGRRPDFPESPENSQIILETLQDMGVDERRAIDADTLEIAFNRAIRAGRITPNAPETAPAPPVSRGAAAAPQVPTPSAPGTATEMDIERAGWDMPIEKLQAYLLKHGQR